MRSTAGWSRDISKRTRPRPARIVVCLSRVLLRSAIQQPHPASARSMQRPANRSGPGEICEWWPDRAIPRSGGSWRSIASSLQIPTDNGSTTWAGHPDKSQAGGSKDHMKLWWQRGERYRDEYVSLTVDYKRIGERILKRINGFKRTEEWMLKQING